MCYIIVCAAEEKFSWVLIFAVQCQETTPTNSFACEITSAWEFIPVLIFVLLLFCPRKTRKFAPHENYPLYIRYQLMYMNVCWIAHFACTRACILETCSSRCWSEVLHADQTAWQCCFRMLETIMGCHRTCIIVAFNCPEWSYNHVHYLQ